MRLPPLARFLFRAYLTLVSLGLLFRLLLLGSVLHAWQPAPLAVADLLQAFFIGWRFDTCVAGYLLAVPFLLLSLAAFVPRWARVAVRGAHGFLMVVALPMLLVLAADIPWFLHNYARFSTAAFQWAGHGAYVLGLVTQERSFALYLLPALGGYALALLGLRWARAAYGAPAMNFRSARIAVPVLGLLLFLAMRGRVDEKSPIQPGLAYFSDDPLMNQLGLNPLFTLGASYEKSFTAARRPVQLADDEPALWYATKALGGQPGIARSPIARRIQPSSAPERMNVVVILLESMSTFKMGKYGGPADLTPFLTALTPLSLSCENAFSAGIHTYNGIYSTLYSFPALFDEQPMEDRLNKRHRGLAAELRDQGYRTVFSTTHDAEFDNMKGFLSAHGFDRVISEDDYPAAWVASTNGVPDHRMFDHVLPELDALAAHGPFLSVFMTTSDHKPYILPDSLWFTPNSTRLEDRIVEYVDRSVARFFVGASKRSWYRNTLFVILGDHGVNMGHTYDLPLTFHHTPLLFHAPGGQVSPGRLNAPCGQIDVAPTILGMLRLPWTNTTAGLDVREHPRTAMYFCADDRIGCIDSEHYFIHRMNGGESLFAYHDLANRDVQDSLPHKRDALRDEAFNLMQATHWLVEHDLLDGGAPDSPTP